MVQTGASEPAVVAKFERGARVAGILSATLGGLVLFGWGAGLDVLKNPGHLSAMKPNTAVCFLLSGIALAFAGNRAPRWQGTASRVLAAATVVICAVTLIEYVFGINFGIDELLFRDPVSPLTPPGRMALATAFTFLLLGLAVDASDVETRGGHRPSDWLSAASLLPPLFGAADYALDWRPELTGMAIHTVVGLMVLGGGVMVMRPGEGWVAALTSSRSGGRAARRLLPFAFIVPLLVGTLRWVGHRAAIYNVDYGLALMMTVTVTVLVVAVWWNGRRLNGLEEQNLRQRERAEAELRHINRALRTIHHCGEALVRAQTEEALLRDVSRVIVDDGGYRMVWVGYAEQTAEKRVRFAAHCGMAEEYAKNVDIRWDESDRGRGPTGTAIRTGQIQTCADFLVERRLAPWRDSAIAHGFRSSAVFPLKDSGTTFGALSIYSAETAAFRKEEIALLAKLAEDLAYGIISLRAREERLRAEEKAYQASLYARNLLEASLDPMVTISRDGHIMDVNHATELVTGYDRERLIGSDFSDYFTEPAKARAGYKEVFEHGSVRDYPLTIRHLSGPVTEVLYNATLYRNAAGEVEGVFAAARDITERKRAEQELAERTAELERSNRELQDFASIASHDLQEPLRKVMAFGDRLRGHAGPALDETGNDYLRRMQNAAERMSSLVEALLEYSRVTTKARPFERVDLNTVVVEVLSDLETRVQESGGRVETGPLPTVMADRLQMQQLLQNLIGNALKFHVPGHAPLVRVTSIRSPNGDWSVVVQDDGIGFDEAYVDRIFRPFQRLHGRSEFPGSGMGLAICRKIVDRHGGTITARSCPGEGTAFTFTLACMRREETSDADVEAGHHLDCGR